MYKKYITKYPRTHSNPEIITRSNLYLDFPPYSINLLNPFLSLSLSQCFPRINRGPVFRERCSKRGEEKFFFRERRAPLAASSPLPFQARGFRYSAESATARRGEGEGRRIALFRKESTRAAVQGKRFQSPPQSREEKRDWTVFMSRSSRWAASSR